MALGVLLCVAVVSCLTLCWGEPVDQMDCFNVQWDSMSADSSGSMPLGNGDVGLNVWVEPGALCFYISKTDAWSDNGRLLKLGRVRITLDPNPFVDGGPFRQSLTLRKGAVEISAGPEGKTISPRVWVDANRPVVMVEISGDQPFTMSATVEIWRTEPREIRGREMFSAYGMAGSPEPVMVRPDTVLQGQENRVAWFHRNEHSVWPMTLDLQGMGAWRQQATDPLLHRTFGGIMRGEGLVSNGPRMLVSATPAREQTLEIAVHTGITDTAEQWLSQAEEVLSEARQTSPDERREAHETWWDEFWGRSWIRVSGPAPSSRMTSNDLPLRIGADSDGANQFRGHIREVRVLDRALTGPEIAALAAGDPLVNRSGLLIDWALDGPSWETAAATARLDLPGKIVGEVDFEVADGLPAARFDGKGWIEAADAGALNLTEAVTLAAWVRPGELSQAGARIIDKSRAGTSNGYLLDTYPGNSPRMIVETNTLRHDAKLPAGKWSHVAATYDSRTGEQRLYVNGQPVASADLSTGANEIARGYVLQRFISACAGRGRFPIKFNGSLFTVDAVEDGQRLDADYRRWGGPYWFQNTRLAYWPMPASGDWEMMLPLFRMYMDALPFARERTRVYFGHSGAFFPETMTFFGAYPNENYGWDRTGKPVSHVDNTYIRYYYSGGLELVALMLEYLDYTGDADFARDTLAPFAAEIVGFYDQHYPRDAAGKLRIEPSQALETWQKANNPLPPIAGLRWVLPKLLALPEGACPETVRGDWNRLLGELPELPMREGEGGPILAGAAEILEEARNSENPELYAIFPYRLFGVGKPDLEMARRTFEQRRVKGSRGWQQDDTQAALLGLARTAQELIAQRFAQKDPGSRFPAFWGPNFDWVPDQDHGTNGLMALQTMLMQTDGRRVLLFPAWPKHWDVDFRLHAPGNTVVEGQFAGGELRSLTVTPPERRADIEVLEPQ